MPACTEQAKHYHAQQEASQCSQRPNAANVPRWMIKVLEEDDDEDEDVLEDEDADEDEDEDEDDDKEEELAD